MKLPRVKLVGCVWRFANGPVCRDKGDYMSLCMFCRRFAGTDTLAELPSVNTSGRLWGEALGERGLKYAAIGTF
jgi:hypothetical protein